jgi:DNA-binding MarR family transcriptional regulator
MRAESTWNEREAPILEAIWAAEEVGERPGPEQLADLVGLDVTVVARAVTALVDAKYVAGAEDSSLADRFAQYNALWLLERGRRAIGQWPPGPGDAFLVTLNRLIAAETDPEERSRLAKLRDAAADVGKQVLAGAIVAAGQAGMA